ncbi:MAG TPA: response regulator [Candidatus Acidoferrales bacterium]|nr:response regulator [Candidatus Acidoferrales bacterium]
MKGTETIFVVGDHMEFLEIIRINFEDYGYNVLTAVDPYEAILICEAFADEIHLLITDVLMPKMSGKELYEWVRRKRPQMKTIFVSGFAAGMLRPHGVLTDGIEFMQKPFTPEALVRRVREVLAK